MIKLALATSKSPQDLPASDRLLAAALTELGASADPTIWSAEKIRWDEFSAVVIRSCWDYHLRLPEFLSWIDHLDAQGVPVINSPRLIRWNADKRYLKDFAANDVAIPPTVWISESEEANVAKILADRGWQNAVVKPLVSASAHGTERKSAGIVQGPVMVQQYLPAIETEGEWSLIYFDGTFSHAVRKRPRSGDFRVQHDFGGSITASAPSGNLLSLAQSALALLPHPAVFARVDLVEQGPAIYLMEMEVIEPDLLLEYAPGSEHRLAQAILRSQRHNERWLV